MNPEDLDVILDRFSLTEGGPGTAFMRRVRLAHPELGQGSARAALILASITWLPLMVLAVLGGWAVGGVKLPFFHDISSQARFLFAIPVMLLAEIPVGVRLRQVVRHFIDAHLVADDELERFSEIILDSLQFRDSRIAEIAIVALAYITTYPALSGFSFLGEGTWFRPVPGGGLTLAGYWYGLVALPIFQFLIYRWIYRMLVWSKFLWSVSRLNLLLNPTHPDGAGGLAFLGRSMIPFGLILFALSATLASAIASRILYGGAKLESFQSSYAVLFLIAIAVFAGPMLILAPTLVSVKQRGLLEYGALGSDYTQAFHRKWIEGRNPAEEPLLGTADIQSLADLGGSFEIVQKMRVLPARPADFLALILPGLLPAIPLAATVMPIGEIVKTLFRLVA
jgi:hypothetical protein